MVEENIQRKLFSQKELARNGESTAIYKFGGGKSRIFSELSRVLNEPKEDDGSRQRKPGGHEVNP